MFVYLFFTAINPPAAHLNVGIVNPTASLFQTFDPRITQTMVNWHPLFHGYARNFLTDLVCWCVNMGFNLCLAFDDCFLFCVDLGCCRVIVNFHM